MLILSLRRILSLLMLILIISCRDNYVINNNNNTCIVKPVAVTDTVKWDTDDPAIWINRDNPENSLIIGTDKDSDGALYVFDLNGKVLEEKTVRNLKRPNNVDVEYGLALNGKYTDIAVVTERESNKIRVYSLPEMKEIDDGGIDVFEGETLRAPMGIALYKNPANGFIYAIVSRKEGPAEGYLWQYLLKESSEGYVIGIKEREFGAYSGIKEIESVAVDDKLGYVYYSDEQFGVRKYYADPDAENANVELGIIPATDYWEDNEGISIYEIEGGTGYILISDQSANRFRVYTREGTPADPEEESAAQPHKHRLVKIVNVLTNNSDGSEVSNVPFNNKFAGGMFVAMSDDKTFQIYSWKDLAGEELISAPNGQIIN